MYSNPSFVRENLGIPGLSAANSAATIALLRQMIATWRQTAVALAVPPNHALPALFDVIMSGLYAQQLEMRKKHATLDVVTHPLAGDGHATVFPYLWICPVCIGSGVHPAQAYLPDGDHRGTRVYARQARLSRPGGRRIGDLGAIVVRLLVESLSIGDPHLTAGGGHRGEFDLVMSSADQIVLGEIKASPLVAFPLVKTSVGSVESHAWHAGTELDGNWWLYVGAADLEDRWIMLTPPADSDDLWPLRDLADAAGSEMLVESLLKAWRRHLEGYRAFNAEVPSTRWQRFGCGNIETVRDGARIQLRVDNTKSLPGIDRTDDIKKGVAQVMLFDRLKKGCRRDAVKTVLFGNLFAETHHEHYLKPIASLRLAWPDHDPVWLFDAIITMSRNIVNDPSIHELLEVESDPYTDDSLDAAAILQELSDDDDTD